MKYSAPGTPEAGNRIIYQIICWVAIITDSIYIKTSINDDVNLIKDIYSGISMLLSKLVWDWKIFIKEKIQFGE